MMKRLLIYWKKSQIEPESENIDNMVEIVLFHRILAKQIINHSTSGFCLIPTRDNSNNLPDLGIEVVL